MMAQRRDSGGGYGLRPARSTGTTMAEDEKATAPGTGGVDRPAGWELLVWTGTRALLLACVLGLVAFPGLDVTTDVSVIYRDWAHTLGSGVFPPDDVTWQYPPAAALPILAPGLLGFLDYAAGFFVLACAADAAVLAMLLRASRGGGRRAGVWVWVLGVPLLGPTAYARYDLLVTAVAVAALLAAVRRPAVAGALAGFGAMLKVWPVLVLLGTPRGGRTRTAWGTAVAVAVAVAAGFAVAMPGAFAFLTAQGERGTEVESLGALVFHAARFFGWEGRVELHYGSMEFLGPHVPLVSTAALVLSAAACGWLLLWRLRAAAWTPATHADAAFTAVLLFTTTSRVLSPQYMIWLLGAAAVCAGFRAGRMLLPAWLVVAATAVTVLEFPLGFAYVVESDPAGVLLLAVRNGLLVVASVVAARRLWRSTVTAPRRVARTEADEPGPAEHAAEAPAADRRAEAPSPTEP